MTRKVIAGALALSLAFAGVSAAPANAGNDKEVGRVLAGALALFVIGQAIQDAKRRKQTPPQASRPQPPRPEVSRNPVRWPVRPPARRHSHPPAPRPTPVHIHRPVPRPTTLPVPRPGWVPDLAPAARRDLVPGECAFALHRNGKRREVFGKACVDETMYRPERLPLVCLDRVNVRYGRAAQVYDARCLREFGFIGSEDGSG